MAGADEENKPVTDVKQSSDAPTEGADPEVSNETKDATDASVESSEKGAEKEDEKATTASGTPAKRGRKRKSSVADDKSGETDAENAAEDAGKDEQPVDGADAKTEQKKPTKRAKATTPKPKKKPGRPKKHAEDSDDEDAELAKRVDALPEEIKSKYGTIVWVKMGGYPYWPALVVDPRFLSPKLQAQALKDPENKCVVCFYQTQDFSPSLFKNIESWDDTKFPYREGHPTKDAKAPKRRDKLMIAIDLADKDALLPVEERMNGLLKAPEPEEQKEETTPSKRKPGRPAGSKNKKPTEPKAKRGKKKAAEADDGEETEEETPKKIQEEEEEDAAGPPRTKEEIKAKVASRKTPSKKKAGGEEKAPAVAKKATKPSGSKSDGKAEIDSKRKKEIELVVPRKTVKSSDIREATEEAARKKLTKEPPKDKGEYQVGNLSQFAKKMTRLHAKESSKNNDELIQMLRKLFDEKDLFRSDVERSGLAAIIAILRKSTNPTVATTASAVRKHLMKILNDDTSGAGSKHKSDSGDDGKPAKKQKTSASPSPSTDSVEEKKDIKKDAEETSEENTKKPAEAVKSEQASQPETEKESQPTIESKTDNLSPKEDASTTEPAAPEAKLTPTESAAKNPDPSTDKKRMSFIDMLSKALESNGSENTRIAREIEDSVFDRFKNSGADYQSFARVVTFGFKKNEKLRERLFSGSLQALEVAYQTEEFFKGEAPVS
ncbi:hypothetical protein Poli38472_003033 [Pythium oligandrum]|uniref:PWWP domain-containing protein n=1 Tax=Pythium oligandrum TaxID=41045 RepID=A0A8K1C633_PYTOL|nr:hypothetical protein Poli38472_003033 [Pythium oligandrum]|eukprot:TMW57108.1 hypothetical protein Poli38472_003033 [Pythium oligandrum]